MRTSFWCPTTAALITVNLKDDAKSVRHGWRRSVNLKCPHCGEMHAVRYRDMYVDGVLSEFRADLEELLRNPTAQIL